MDENPKIECPFCFAKWIETKDDQYKKVEESYGKVPFREFQDYNSQLEYCKNRKIRILDITSKSHLENNKDGHFYITETLFFCNDCSYRKRFTTKIKL